MLERKDYLQNAHLINSWIQEYFDRLESLPVKSSALPGQVISQIPESPPEKAESIQDIIQDLEDIILPGMTHWQHPNFHAYFPANSSVESVLAETVTAALAAQCMIWDTSPAAAELEEQMMNWLAIALGLPQSWEGVIQDTASTATLVAILSAREKSTDYSSNDQGVPQNLTVYCSEETHSSIDKAVAIAGIGRNNLRLIPCDDHGAMEIALLEQAIKEDLAEGKLPVCVIGTMGTTGRLAFDDLNQIGSLCNKYNVWFHVDAAFAGIAMILPEYRRLGQGLEYADSFVVNPHKWMFTNFDCTAYYVRDKEALLKTFEVMPEYLKTTNRGQVNDYRDWGIQLGRRFRALKLWFVMRSYGLQGIRDTIRKHLDLTKYFVSGIEKIEGIQLVTPPTLNVCTFRYNPKAGSLTSDQLNEFNARLLGSINNSGKAYVTHTKIDGAYVIRMVIGQTYVGKKHIDAFLSLLSNKIEVLSNGKPV